MSLKGSIFQFTTTKTLLAANHMPIAVLPVPVAGLVRMPVGVIPIGIGMYINVILPSQCTNSLIPAYAVLPRDSIDEVCPRRGTLELSWSVRGGVFMVAGMAVPEESFVISFGDVLVSPHSISFSHTFSDGLTLLLGMRGGDASGFVHSYWDKDAAEKAVQRVYGVRGATRRKRRFTPKRL
jgi:hypothetical protein